MEEKGRVVRIIIGTALLLAACLLPLKGWLRPAVFLVPYLLAGWEVLREALEGLLHREIPGEDFLMAAATLGALAIGEYPEAVMVMLLFQVGELFEDYAQEKSRRSISALMQLRPDSVNMERNGELVKEDPQKVQVGQEIVVKPGERIPLDGIIESGKTELDTAALTGESLPRTAEAGEVVLSGCVNLTGLIRVRVTKPYAESTVTRILALVENAGEKKSKSETLVERFAKIYTPAVVSAAVLLAVLPPLLMDGAWSEWLRRALTFLVVSCPCALVISVPLTFFCGIGGASNRGILIKGSDFLETLSNCDAIVFDKTGTLTEGAFHVLQVCPANPEKISSEELLELAAAAESGSEHPIAQSLREGRPVDGNTEMKQIAGEGVEAYVQGRTISVGNKKRMAALGLQVSEVSSEGTAVHVACDGEYLGYILIGDRVRRGAAEALDALRQSGIRRLVMLTGDREEATRPIAEKLGISEWHAGLLPQEKVSLTEAILSEPRKGGRLAFVGDGVNDAPVLARADLGVAMGAMGSDAAIEAADVVLMNDDLSSLPLARKIADRTMRIARQNIAFSLSVKAIVLLLGMIGLVSMWLAVFADVGVTILAVINAMRALRMPKQKL